MITITINGKSIAANPGETILQAARRNGVEIPALCLMMEDRPIGSCGLCVVKILREDRTSYVRACTTKVEDGMLIETHPPEIEEARKTILELLAEEHEVGGELQALLDRYGINVERREVIREEWPENPFIFFNPKACISCFRCVQTCGEIKENHVLVRRGRGARIEIVAGVNDSLKDAGCAFCGACIDACPTGALIEKTAIRAKGPLKKVTTICPYCGVGCAIDYFVQGNRIVYARGNPEGVNRGDDCLKGRFGWEFVHSEERLKRPLIKRDGKFVEVSWDEALDYVAQRLREIREKYGADSIAGLSSAKCTNEENYLFQKFMRTVIGTNNVDHCARLCHASTVVGLFKVFGSGAMTNSIEDLMTSEVFFVIGSNTTHAHPVIGTLIKRAVKRGAKLIVADPRNIELARYATIHLRHRPGTDVALINGMMHVIVKYRLADYKFVEERTEGFEKLKEVVEKYTPERVERITGVPRDDIIRAAILYATHRSAIIYAMGITQHTSGTANVASLANLALLTGNVGKEGSGVNPLRGQNNVQGAGDMGALPNLLPGYVRLDAPYADEIERIWGTKIPREPGLTVVEMMHAALKGKIKAMYIMGENPAVSDPDRSRVIESLKNLEFLVVQDLFLSETAQLADVVLPAASSLEKEGTFTNTERRVQLLRRVIEPVGEAKPDWWIITQLANRMGASWSYGSPKDIFEEIRKVVPQYRGITYKRIEKLGIQWPCTDEEHPGTPILHVDRFPTPTGLARFAPYEYKPPAEESDEEYPYILTTGRTYEHFHTGTLTRKMEGFNELMPEAFVEISSDDAEKLGIKNGDCVVVESRRGAIRVKAKISKIKKGVVFIPFHFAESAANTLTLDALDPEAKIPELKVAAVRLKRC